MMFLNKRTLCAVALLWPLVVWAQPASEEPLLPSSISIDYSDAASRPQRFSALPWKGTLLFEEQELKDIYRKLHLYNTDRAALLNYTPTDELEDQLFDDLIGEEPSLTVIPDDPTNGFFAPGENQRTIELPAVYLGSIIYENPKDWTIWLNGKRLRPGEELSRNVEVIDVNEESVVVELVMEQLDILVEDWPYIMVPYEGRVLRENFAGGGEWSYISKNGDVLLDDLSGIVRAEIGLYQSFSAAEMAVVEGKVTPEQVVVTRQDYFEYLGVPYTPPARGSRQESGGVFDSTDVLDDIFGD